MKTGIELITQERREQIHKHGYHSRFINDHPELYENDQMAFVAGMLLAVDWEEGIDRASFPSGWEEDCERMLRKSRKERLIIAGALLAAEIDRLQQ